MFYRIHFTPPTVKDLQARWRRAGAQGDRRLTTRISCLLWLGQGQPVSTVAATLAVAESTLYTWLHAFLERGLDSLVYRRSPGRPAKLTGTQKDRLRALLAAGPEAAGYATGAWSAPLIQHLIEHEFGVLYNVHYVTELLHNLGYTYQKARFVSDHLDEAGRVRWLDQWAAIAQEVLMRGARLLFGDEASFAQWGSLGYTWAPRGEQPLVKTTGRRKAYKVWGVVDWFSGWLFVRGHEGRFTAASYCAFLAEVLAQSDQPVILVQDGARYHTAKETQRWLAAHADRITVVQLPTYSPDYNPIEHVWRYVKEGTHCAYFATFAALVTRVEERLGHLRCTPDRVHELLGTPLDDCIGQPLPVAVLLQAA
jgi:transposase